MTDIRRPWVLDPGRTPVERILGKEFGSGGPLGLLGLTPGDCTPDTIAAALSRQLERISDHPHATSHEADDVRLALHAAAAQLMDPRTRDAVITAALIGSGWKRPRRPLSPIVVARARAEIRRTLGRFGGLNERSIRFLSLVADRHGIARDQLAEAVRASVREPGRAQRSMPARDAATPTRGPALGGRGVGEPVPTEIDPAVRMLRLVLILGAFAIVTVGLAVLGIWMVLRATDSPPAPTPPAAIATPASGPVKPLDVPRAANPADAPGEAMDPVALARSLSESVDQLAAGPDAALQQFTKAFRGLSSTWVELEPDRAASTQDAVVEFLYRAAANPPVAEAAARVILEGAMRLHEPPLPIDADRVLPGVWSVGTLARLARERELPARVRAMIDSELAAASSGVLSSNTGSFGAGASAALLSIPRSLVKARTETAPAAIAPPAAFEQWLKAARAVTGGDPPALTRLVLGALETILLDGPEPDPSSPCAACVAVLVGAEGWRDDSEARARLVRWFDSASVTSADLGAVTRALASSSGAQGVDATMVLAPRADLPQRQEMRDRYLAAWSLQDRGVVDALVAEWAKAANPLVPADHAAPTPTEQLARAAILARINLAATLLHAGLSAEPGDVLRSLDAPVLAALGSPTGAGVPTSLGAGGTDGSWAVKYLAAEKNIPLRAALLSDFGQQSGTLGPVDADVLAAEAFRGAPAQVRRAAADLLVKFSASPAVINAALEQAPFIAPSQENADLVAKVSLGRVPAVRDPEWRLGVRRALVERLLQMLASGGEDRAVDALSGVLADAYAGRASVGAVDRTSAGAGGSRTVDAAAAARAVRTAWQRWAEGVTPTGREPLTLDQVQRRYAGRGRLSEGLVQAFAAEQFTTVELMAYVIAAERAESAGEVRAILDRLGASRRLADHVFAQILAAERAMTELWMIRLNTGGPA